MRNNQSRYAQLFKTLQQKGEIAWIPFVMLGYPDMQRSIKYLETFIENGADALEIGIPFSDPVADGVLIQESARVALEQGSSVGKCMAALTSVREKYPDIPMGLLTYANLVYRPGIATFYGNCFKAGVDSVLIADLPLLEAQPFIDAAASAQVDAVFIAPPNASDSTIQTLSKLQGGYTYVVSRAGVTGDNNQVEYPEKIVKSLLHYQAPPPVLGFGISKPEHVAKAAALGFKGVISGSAITRIISNYASKTDSKSEALLLNELKVFSEAMKIHRT